MIEREREMVYIKERKKKINDKNIRERSIYKHVFIKEEEEDEMVKEKK